MFQMLKKKLKNLNGEIRRYRLVLFLLIILVIPNINATPGIDIDDTYTFDDTSSNDLVAFENYDFDFQVYGLDQGSDMVCYNWDVYGGTDNYEDDGGNSADFCIYANSLLRDDCISCYGITVPTGNMQQKSDLSSEVHGQVCDGCEFDTSDRYGDEVEAIVYHDCQSCNIPTKTIIDSHYFVIKPRQYLCESNGIDEFLLRGVFPNREQSNTLEWISYDGGKKVCSEIYNSNNYACSDRLDEMNDNIGSSSLAPPCALLDGVACFSNLNCISGICEGDRTELESICDSDGSDGYQIITIDYDNSCGGEGLQDTLALEDDTCSNKLSGYYVCDLDLTGEDQLLTTDAEDFCRVKEYSSCSSSSQCWNNNGGYDCMGSSASKVCTTGANAKTCSNNDDLQCDSGRCDTICQARLSNGALCDENSDCLNGACSGGICGGSGIITDLAVVDIIPVQVVKNVDLVKGKSGIVRIVVSNYGNQSANGTVTTSFDGQQLSIHSGDQSTKLINPSQNISFDFDFNPNSTGTKQIVANVTVN